MTLLNEPRVVAFIFQTVVVTHRIQNAIVPIVASDVTV